MPNAPALFATPDDACQRQRQRPLALSVRPLYSGLMRDDDSAPMWGPGTVTQINIGGRQQDNAVVYWWVKGHV